MVFFSEKGNVEVSQKGCSQGRNPIIIISSNIIWAPVPDFFIGEVVEYEVLLLIIQLWVVKHKSFTFYSSFLLLKGNMSLVGKFFLSLFDCSLVSSTPLERINPKFRGVFLFRQNASYNKSCIHLSISLNNTNEMENS